MASIRKVRNRWQATYRGPDGKELQSTFDRKADAEKWVTSSLSSILTGE